MCIQEHDRTGSKTIVKCLDAQSSTMGTAVRYHTKEFESLFIHIVVCFVLCLEWQNNGVHARVAFMRTDLLLNQNAI